MVLFRADGNSIIGSGHVMRCLSIAREASKFDDVLFLSADCNFEEAIRDVGISFRSFNTRYDQLEEELPQIKTLLEENRPTSIFIDSYFVTEYYLTEIRNVCRKVSCKLVYIDDLLSFAYPCDYLINYNIYGLDSEGAYKQLYEKKVCPQFLLGPTYAPLRNEFRDVPLRLVNSSVENILVSTGGADSEHIALRLAEEINKAGSKYLFHFVIGSKNNDFGKIKNIIEHSEKNNVVLHRDVKNMAELMSKCDIAISAAGSTLYELCATQTPTITYVLADNQIPGAESFKRHDIMEYIGDLRCEKDFIAKLFNAINKLASSFENRQIIAKYMRLLVDGRGASRIFDAIGLKNRKIILSMDIVSVEKFAERYDLTPETIKKNIDKIPGALKNNGKCTIPDSARYPYNLGRLKLDTRTKRVYAILKATDEFRYIDFEMLKISKNSFDTLVNELVEKGFLQKNGSNDQHGLNSYDVTLETEQYFENKNSKQIMKWIDSVLAIVAGGVKIGTAFIR